MKYSLTFKAGRARGNYHVQIPAISIYSQFIKAEL
jgi:hypothetical protein